MNPSLLPFIVPVVLLTAVVHSAKTSQQGSIPASHPPQLNLSALWSYNHTSGLQFPVFDDRRIYTQDANGMVLALSKVSGYIEWRTNVRFVGTPAAHPSVAGEYLYAQGRVRNATASTWSPGMYCLNSTTGKILWTRAFANPMNIHVTTHQNGLIYLSTEPKLWDATVFCLQGDTGKVVWTRSNVSACTRIMAEGDVVYFGTHWGSMAASAATGETIWAFETGPGQATNEPGLGTQQVFFGDFHNLYAVDKATGKEQWRFTVPNTSFIANGATFASSLRINGETSDVVFFEIFKGDVYALNATSGLLIARSRGFSAFSKDFLVIYEARYLFAPSVADNRLFAFDIQSVGEGKVLKASVSYAPKSGWVQPLDHWPNEIVIDHDARAGFVVAGSSIWALRLFD